jgi:hypothetical protein
VLNKSVLLKGTDLSVPQRLTRNAALAAEVRYNPGWAEICSPWLMPARIALRTQRIVLRKTLLKLAACLGSVFAHAASFEVE